MPTLCIVKGMFSGRGIRSAADPFSVFNVADLTVAMANWAAQGLNTHREILAEMASRLFGSHLRIIATTAHVMSSERERFLLAGINGFVSKPLMPDDIHRRLAEVSSRR